MQQHQQRGVLWRVRQQLVPLEWLVPSREQDQGTEVWISRRSGELWFKFFSAVNVKICLLFTFDLSILLPSFV
jgi:hypothetical protein